jgi:hypothetical protein
MPASPLTEQFLKLGARDQRQPCRIGSILEGLKPTERREVDQALRSDNKALRRGASAWLEQQHGVKFNTAALSSHRGNNCTCRP